LNGTVLAVSTDTMEDNEKLARRKDIDFPLLADPELKAIDAYGLRHPGGGPYGDVARPATFIIDAEGRIVWRELTDNWRVRVRPEPVLEQLRTTP
jgi:peroxiredoxin Q/BCP